MAKSQSQEAAQQEGKRWVAKRVQTEKEMPLAGRTAAQGKHVDAAVAPRVALYVPDGHALHTVLAAALQEPGAQQVPAPALL